jgi:TctA family transporter
MGIGVLIAAAVCYVAAPLMVKVTQVSPHILFGILMPLIVLGAYVGREFAVDIIVIGITSFLGLCIKRFGFSAPALILGFVMGALLERYLVRALDIFGLGFFWSSPAAIVLTLIILVAIFYSPAKSLIDKVRGGGKTPLEGQA